MSHVTALPAPEPASFDESAAEVAHYAIATLQQMDIADVTVTTVGFLAVARFIYGYVKQPGVVSYVWSALSLVKRCGNTAPRQKVS